MGGGSPGTPGRGDAGGGGSPRLDAALQQFHDVAARHACGYFVLERGEGGSRDVPKRLQCRSESVYDDAAEARHHEQHLGR